MFIFNDQVDVVAWGPTATVRVRIPALEGLINDSWMLTSLSLNAQDIVDIRQCFNDVSYIYALGNDQQRCALSLYFVILLGRRNCRPTSTDNFGAISEGLKKFVTTRISNNTAPMALTIGNFSCKGWLTGESVDRVDPDTGIGMGSLHFIMQLEGE